MKIKLLTFIYGKKVVNELLGFIIRIKGIFLRTLYRGNDILKKKAF